VLGRNSLSFVGYLKNRLVVIGEDPNRDACRLGRVDECVLEQIGYDLAESVFITYHYDRCWRIQPDLSIRLNETSVDDGVCRDLHEIDAVALQGTALIEACKHQQVLDHVPRPDCVLLNSTHRISQLSLGLDSSHAIELRVPANRGNRRA
jgi:hypothetical protein